MNLKSKILLVGSCQMDAMLESLGTQDKLLNKYDLESIVVFKEDIDESSFKEKLKNTSFLIAHKINTETSELFNYDNLRKLSHEFKFKFVILPYMFFNGYWPNVDYIIHNGEKLGQNGNLYHEKRLYELVQQNDNLNLQNIFDRYSQQISLEDVIDNLLNTLSIMHEKNKVHDDVQMIDILSFIIKNYKTKKLFYTNNHPTLDLIKYCTKMTMNILKIDCDDLSLEKTKNILNTFVSPIHHSVRDGLSLKFEDKKLVSYNKEISLYDWLKDEYELYSNLIKL